MPFLSAMLNCRSRARTLGSIAAFASLGLALGSLPAQAKIAALETLFVFGDSYSDAGNSGLLTQGIPP